MTLTRAARRRRVSDAVAVAGVGETDYAADYARARTGAGNHDEHGYAVVAFRRALTNAGLARDDIDGLVAGPTLNLERTGEMLGLNPQWAVQADAANAVIAATTAIHAGLAECVALVYGNAQRSAGTPYGGPGAAASFLAYVYYAPWGLTSQGALYAMLASRYMALTGFTVDDLGEIVTAQRRHAQLNPNAVMRKPLSLPDYRASRLICEPLRLYDYCLINDGGVCLIVTTVDRARTLPTRPVLISGVGRTDMDCEATSLQPRLEHFYRPGQRAAAAQVYEMAGVGPEDIDLLQVYDSFSVHVVLALEGFGFAPEGEVAGFVRDGGIGPGGRLPVNTSGGHLSDSYMQGWNHQAEAVRQLRGEAGDRQVPDARLAQYVSDAAGKVATIVYRRDDA